MRPTRLLLAVTALTLAVGLGACGGDDTVKTLTTPTATPTTTASATGDSPSRGVGDPASTTPVAESPAQLSADWKPTLTALVATDTTPAQKAAAISGGQDLVPTMTKLAGAIKGLVIDFKVQNPVVTGTSGKADIVVISGGKPFPKTYPAFFDLVAGTWQVNRVGACSLIALSGVTCPDNG